jgi:hypothetical protein
LVYEKVLREEGGVKTGLPHCWWEVFKVLKATAEKNDDTVKGIGWLLGREPGKTSQ